MRTPAFILLIGLCAGCVSVSRTVDTPPGARDAIWPLATLWLTPDGVVHRTAIPGHEDDPVQWAVMCDGRLVLTRGANREMQLPELNLTGRIYTIYLQRFTGSEYRVASNVLTFTRESDAADIKRLPPVAWIPEDIPLPDTIVEAECWLRQIGHLMQVYENTLATLSSGRRYRPSGPECLCGNHPHLEREVTRLHQVREQLDDEVGRLADRFKELKRKQAAARRKQTAANDREADAQRARVRP